MVVAILINLGTPTQLTHSAIRSFLDEFLMDRRVVSLPYLLRYMLVKWIIKPFRPRKIIANYESIWGEAGSPLVYYVKSLCAKLNNVTSNEIKIDYAMRYGEPSIQSTFLRYSKAGYTRFIVVPLFPQYASATVGSVQEEVFRALYKKWHIPAINFLPPFYDDERFIQAQGELAKDLLTEDYDYYLFSYHGIPTSHLFMGENATNICLTTNDCCAKITKANGYCYRAQSYATTTALSNYLNLDPAKTITVFQSKFGRAPWILPALDEVIVSLATEKQAKRLLVFCPSFLSDCVETLEEVAIRSNELFIKHGGEKLTQVPCVNDSKLWVDNLATMIKESI